MTIVYLEGAGPNEPYGIVFSESLFGEISWGKITPGPAETNLTVVPDVRAAHRLLIDSTLDRAFPSVLDLDEIDVPVPEPYVKAMESLGLTCNPLLAVPGRLAIEIFERRKSIAEDLVAQMSKEELTARSERTHAKLVLLECERRGFIWDGKLTKPKFNLATSKTGRFSTTGFNVMAIKKEDRHRLTARPGYVLASFDFKSIDGRSVVALSEEARARYGAVDDVYGAIFTDVFKKEPTNEERDAFKITFFQYAYGPEVSRYSSNYLHVMLNKLEWLIELRHRFYRPDEHDHMGQGLAWEAQRMSSRAFNSALTDVLPFFIYAGGILPLANPLFTVHDELLVEMLDDSAVDHTCRLFSDVMAAGASVATGVKHVVKHKTGRTYAEC